VNTPLRLPLVRALSAPVTSFLVGTPVSPNAVTLLSLAAGAGAAACYYEAEPIAGALLFAVCYVLDNVDGELARATGKGSKIGQYLDDIVDWLVHALFFLALGAGAAATRGNELWFWLGAAAAFGGTMSSVVACFRRDTGSGPEIAAMADLPPEASILDRLNFLLRGLVKADFWLLVLLLSLFDLAWLLLPAAAIGGQVFWMLQFLESARRIHT